VVLAQWVFTARTVVRAVVVVVVVLLDRLLGEAVHLLSAMTAVLVLAAQRSPHVRAVVVAGLGLPGLTLLQAKAVTAG
jgi:hypothetical protein